MHVRYAVILIMKVYAFNLLQVEGSSDPSGQSVPPSQYQWAGIQRPFEQRNSFWVHVDVAGEAKQILSNLNKRIVWVTQHKASLLWKWSPNNGSFVKPEINLQWHFASKA